MRAYVVNNLSKRFKDPPDVYTAIYPLYCLCAIAGLAPYKIVRLESGRKEFKFDLWALIKSAVLVLLFTGSVFYSLIYYREPFKESDIRGKLRTFQEIFSTLLTCVSVILGCVFATRIIEVFKNIDEIDVSFRGLAVWVPYKDIYMRIILHLTIISLAVVAAVVNYIFNVLYDDVFGSDIYIASISFMTLSLPYVINLIMELEYIHYLNILRMRYRLLNEYLEALVQEDNSYNGWITEEVTNVSNTLSEEPPKTATSETGKIPKSIVAISDPVFIVDQVAALHIQLTDMSHMINHAFCVQHLLRITVAFVSIVTALFLIASNFSKSSTDDDSSQMDVFFTCWAFSNACEVTAIVWISSETCEEANTCPRILHKIRNNTSNEKLQDTIEIYSLQMYHNRLSFTVCGLFPLDYTLLYTIVAGVTTYLVILIQFSNADVKTQTNSTMNVTITSVVANLTDS